MVLEEGVYENLITRSLQSDIHQTEQQNFVCSEGKIDEAEQAHMLAEHVSRVIENRLSMPNMTGDERTCLVNCILDFIGQEEENAVVDKEHMLTSVLRKEKHKALQIVNAQPIRPLTGLRVSSLFTGGQGAISLSSEIKREIASANSISLLVSFLKLSGVNLIYDDLKKFCEDETHHLRIITTTYCGVTDAKAVERLSMLPRCDIKISYETQADRLHAKAYIFERNNGLSTAYIGSSNLSSSGHTEGIEWNVRVTYVENPHIIKTAMAMFDRYWNSWHFEDFKDGGIQRFYQQTRKEKARNAHEPLATKYALLPHQKQILDKLAIKRRQGIWCNLVVAATGTGKTVVSAFDYQNFIAHNNEHHRILFVAHREEILKQALSTYRCVLADNNFAELWVGNNQPADVLGNLFVSIQTFNAHYNDFFQTLPENHYNYIVVYEAHHIAANSYRAIISHFRKATVLLGLTATPERMDGKSLLPDFDNTISAEIRLPKALDEGLLCPFQYLCINDNETNLTAPDLMKGHTYITSKIAPILCSVERTDLIINKLRYYLPDENRCKALCYCANKEHALYTAQRFQQAGLRAACLTSDNSEDREHMNKQLSRGEINYLCVVDMFNEGVDIPSVDTVLFLRPTESTTIFLQQLGRGLRLAPGKELLTVFDFVSQLNRNYDLTSRFRSLLTDNNQPMAKQIENGFTLLPHGCSIYMEEKAKKTVLENIQSAIYNKMRIVRELSTYSSCPSLSQFIDNNGQDVRILYSHGKCWTQLKREAGWCKYEDDDTTQLLTKGIGTLCHVNTLAYLRFVNSVMSHNGALPESLTDVEEKYALMLYYTLFQETTHKLGYASVTQALKQLAQYPLFMEEIQQLVGYLMGHLSTETFPIDNSFPALEQYGCYTREEIFILMGRQTAEKKMRGSVTGVFRFDELNTEAFFVTLNKSDKDFSPSTQYDDYIIGEKCFHWQSQNTDSHNGTGKRFIEQRNNKKKFILFVREYKKDGYGNTSPFHCFGLIDYIRSYNDKPMNIEWHLHEPVLPEYMKTI